MRSAFWIRAGVWRGFGASEEWHRVRIMSRVLMAILRESEWSELVEEPDIQTEFPDVSMRL